MGIDWVPGEKGSYGGNALVAAAVAIAAVQIIFVVARFYTRFIQRTKIGFDDYLILLALTASLAKSAIYIVMAQIGPVGYHVQDMDQINEKPALLRKYLFILQVLDYPFSVTPAKMALLLFYARIFTVRKFKLGVYIVGSLLVAVGLTALIEVFFQCRPFAHIWNKSVPGTCTSQTQVYRILSPINAFTGLIILIMPIPEVWKLHAPRGQKLVLTGVFLLGGLGTMASIMRMAIYITEKAVAMDDAKWITVKLAVCVLLESAVLIVAGCLLSIWPLITRILPRRLQASFARMPRESQHRYWYLRDIHSNSKSQERIARCREVHMAREDAWSSSPSSPYSLADLEDQRLLILGDDMTESRFFGGRCDTKSFS